MKTTRCTNNIPVNPPDPSPLSSSPRTHFFKREAPTLKDERTTGRKKGQEAEHSHLRKGVAGDWRNHFTDVHVKQFKSSYPGLLARLGYEADDNW